MSSTGTTTSRSSAGGTWASTTATGRSPPRKRATSSGGRAVADRPIRWGSSAASADSRSRDRARWAPRLVAAMAWISSTMIQRTVRSDSRAWEPRMRKSDSGVVTRTSPGSRTMRRRSLWGVSPVRTSTRGGRKGRPAASAARSIPTSGTLRFRSMS